MDKASLDKLISNKHIENIDLSELDLNETDFSGCTIRNVIFSTKEQHEKEIKNLNFKDARLENVFFNNAILEHCCFDTFLGLKGISFMHCTLNNCSFRGKISWVDFRYARMNMVNFAGTTIDYCDFYHTHFGGEVIFRGSKISNTYFYFSYFTAGPTLRKDNIVGGKILQEDLEAYKKYLNGWSIYLYRNWDRKENPWLDSAVQPNYRVRYEEAEEFFKTLNGLWVSMGFYSEANWAYVRGKRMERKKMVAEFLDNRLPLNQRIQPVFLIFWNFISDIMFGYGESMLRMILSYVVIIFLFAYFYYASPDVSLATYNEAVGISFKNMLAMSSDKITSVSPLVDFLNVVQTTVGILITGIFGFMLGNKIRNQ